MENNIDFLRSEYNGMLTFIMELQSEELQFSEELLKELKELEYKVRQRELILKEQEKRSFPNISMFSPLDAGEAFDMGVEWKDELAGWKEKLPKMREKCEAVKEKSVKLTALKKFFIQLEPFLKHPENGCSPEICDCSMKLLTTQELDRNRIARDLHDSTIQNLTMLVHKAEYCSRLVEIDQVRARLELQSMMEMIKATINDMREIIYDLRPMSLNNIGLVAAVDSYCVKMKKNNELDISLRVTGKEKDLSSIIRVTLYRIIQEACNNIMAHASAHKVIVSMNFEAEKVTLQVEDDGIGFDVTKVEEHSDSNDELHGFGLSTMRERARLLKGTFSIQSQPGKGTKVEVSVPV